MSPHLCVVFVALPADVECRRRWLSDKAKTFKAGSEALRKITSDQRVHFSNLNIKWEFMLEKAMQWGEFFERMVGSVKRCLKKTLGRATLT